MRIAIVTTHPPSRGSLTEYGYHFVRTLCQKPGVAEVLVLAEDLPPGQQYPMDNAAPQDAAHCRIISCWRFGAWSTPLRILAAVRRYKPDVVLFNIQFASFGPTPVSAALGLLTPALVKACGFPTIVLLHNLVETVDLAGVGLPALPLMTWLLRVCGTVATRLLLRADRVAVTLPRYAAILDTKYHAANVLLIAHGSFDAVSAPMGESPANPPYLLAFGKFGTYKKVETLIEAFILLQAEGRSSLELVIAGTDTPRAVGYLADVQRRYAHLRNLRFIGYVAEDAVAEVFGPATAVVLPYTATTGSSGVLHQAGLYGKAVVLPRLGDLADLVTDDGYAGEYFEPGNATSLAHAISRVLDDPAHRLAIEAQNRAAARMQPLNGVVDTYLRHCRDLHAMAAKRRKRPVYERQRTRRPPYLRFGPLKDQDSRVSAGASVADPGWMSCHGYGNGGVTR